MGNIVNQLLTFQIILLLELIQQLKLPYVEPSLMVLFSLSTVPSQHIRHQQHVQPEYVRLLPLPKEL